MNLIEQSRHFTVKYCTQCQKSFETNSYGGRLFLAYYKDMPTYGLERKACPKHDPLNNTKYLEEKL